MVFGSEAFGRWLGPEGGALINGISALQGKRPELFYSLPCEDIIRGQTSVSQEGGLPQEPDHAGALNLDFQPLEQWEINDCF